MLSKRFLFDPSANRRKFFSVFVCFAFWILIISGLRKFSRATHSANNIIFNFIAQLMQSFRCHGVPVISPTQINNKIRTDGDRVTGIEIACVSNTHVSDSRNGNLYMRLTWHGQWFDRRKWHFDSALLSDFIRIIAKLVWYRIIKCLPNGEWENVRNTSINYTNY